MIGAGTAGLAVTTFLYKSGHDVTLYEKFNAPKPVGAGLLLQPTGLAVLSALGLDKKIIECGSIITQLHGKVVGSRFTTLDVKYKRFKKHYFGVGTHRGDLFSVLYQKVIEQGVKIIVSSEIDAIQSSQEKYFLIDVSGNKSDAYDLVVDCSGAKSHIRQKYADIKLNKPYPYGALWGMVEIKDGENFLLDTLDQRYKNAYHMIGILPVGRNKDNNTTRAAFFWSMRHKDYPQWRSTDLAEWKNYVIYLWPEIRSLVNQFAKHDDLMLAAYSDVILRSYHTGNIVFIGDAAHCTSPQLGQGANMALVDAYILSDCLNKNDTIEKALLSYTKQRKKHVGFYQFASRGLTPFFQSDSWFFAKLRFLFCGLACRIPFTQRITSKLLCGTMLGPFLSLNPGLWSKDYDLRKCEVKTSSA